MARVMLLGMPEAEQKKLQTIFGSVNVSCEVMPSFDAAFERISNDPPALVVAQKPESADPLKSLQNVLRAKAPATPFVVILPHLSAASAMEALRAGAYDCVAPPLTRLDILAAAKRATSRHGRILFVAKVTRPKRKIVPLIFGVIVGFLVSGLFFRHVNGPPAPSFSLGSAHLSGLQWEGRQLWVGDWYDSTVTCYRVRQGFTPRQRRLWTNEIYKLLDGQPILVCNTSDTLVTVGTDLKMRSHQRTNNLPTVQSASVPGTNPTGLTFDGHYLWSCDSETGLLYRHGDDLKVLDTVRSLLEKPAGLAWDGESLWVIGSMPLKLARLVPVEKGYVWQGPFAVGNLLPERVVPSGLAIGFDRLWAISGGNPRLVSIPMADLEKKPILWNAAQNEREKKP